MNDLSQSSSAQKLLEASAEQLPMPSGVALAIMQACEDENTTLQQIAKLVQMDPSLSGNILKLANSAVTGRRPVASVPEAIVRVGMQTVAQLAVAFSLIGNDTISNCPAFDHQKYWTRCLLMAVLSRNLAKTTQIAPPDDIFACGLLGRIGILGLATVYPEAYSDVLSKPELEQTLVEKELFGICHNELSRAMMIDFCVPAALANPTRYYEEPKQSGFELQSRPYKISLVLHLAYRLSEVAISVDGKISTDNSIIQNICTELKIEEQTIDLIFNNSRDEWIEWSEIFQLKADGIKDYQYLKVEGDDQTTFSEINTNLNTDLLKPIIVMDDNLHAVFKTLLNQLGINYVYCKKISSAVQLAINGEVNTFFISQHDHKLMELLRGAKQCDVSYVFFVLDKQDAELEAKAYLAGADDVITVNILSRDLEARLQPAVRMIKRYEQWRNDQTELRRIARELSLSHRQQQLLALTDQLTELPNRRAAMDELEKVWKLTHRKKMPCSLLIIDIDHFKTINDNFGHDVGDEVLKTVADILKKNTRGEDTIARIGGEEFLLISPDMLIREALIRAERLRKTIEKSTINTEGHTINLTISTGISRTENAMRNKEDLIISADKALYAAKKNGRNCIALNVNGEIKMAR
ncbi:GGDEF domain-containing protein [Nitrincola schmidtii]|uniref:sensor domain-containing diguanylate cyclase n=1 Tax=Nitrincola schmidtii TaxID=1730894 RepID=UPI00124D4831|nr:GGDEF domain-containing protein [Nitrincola schmidtii]